MIDLTTETPLPLIDAAKLVPPARSGKKTHLSTILRWILHGAKAPDGQLVRLEGQRLGGRWFTSREALQRFSDRLTPNTDTESAPTPRTAAARQRRSERAERELTAVGI